MTRPQVDPLIEVRDRTRRIETRLTSLILTLGGETEAQKPAFGMNTLNGCAAVRLPSIHSSMKEILDAIPPDHQAPVEVYIGEELVVTLTPRT